MPVDQDGAAVRGEQTEHHFDGGGFACAVRAEETEYFPFPDREADVFHDGAVPKGFADVFQTEYLAHAVASSMLL